MALKLQTAVPPEELGEIKKRAGANVELRVLGKDGRLWVVEVLGSSGELQKFMEKLRLARAGG
ncbi:TIGR04140 family protein [Pyrococcus yayanosii]|uniref:TIGR04140 family protein n=1 Tax=Pyrococcus yayanosii (strain CH1 / JCM 16557) TaxID=529709 RepID=F8AGR0_PYRYC|nr:TIGR04140 family protein [Pyrococcus yayanosii]AEH24036.1 hypothetical protein PYCH_03410 [Pyrococcus yayanosii CH1]